MRFMIYSPTEGTYLECSYGGPFFSANWGSRFSETAETFASMADGQAFIDTCLDPDDRPADLTILPVAAAGVRATMEECIAAGAASWPHHLALLAEDPDHFARRRREADAWINSFPPDLSMVGWPGRPLRSQGRSVWLNDLFPLFRLAAFDKNRADELAEPARLLQGEVE